MKNVVVKSILAAFLGVSGVLVSSPSQAMTPLLPPSATVSSNGLSLSRVVLAARSKLKLFSAARTTGI
jgi:hypothetical protein